MHRFTRLEIQKRKLKSRKEQQSFGKNECIHSIPLFKKVKVVKPMKIDGNLLYSVQRRLRLDLLRTWH